MPAVLAVVLMMFSFESRPRPLPQGLAADILFDGDEASAVARDIAATLPDRRPGSVGDRAAADRVATAFADSGFSVDRQQFRSGGHRLENVIGRRAGESRQQIVVVAARDAATEPDLAVSASDTATLVELARVFEGRPSGKTLVLASLDGSTLGELGAAQLIEELGGPELVDGVFALSALGVRTDEAPSVRQWSTDTTRAGIGLQRTVGGSLRAEQLTPAIRPSPWGQVARLAFPRSASWATRSGVTRSRGRTRRRAAWWWRRR